MRRTNESDLPIARPSSRKHIALLVIRWLMLTLMGWLTYAVARALWTYIRLGAPLYDWQWYLAIILLLLLLSTHLVWRLPSRASAYAVLIGLFMWIVIGYFGFWRVMHVYPADLAPVPISFWARRDIVDAPEPVLEDMQAAGGWAYITVGTRAFDGENGRALVDGLRRLAEHEIEVYLAVVASDYLSVPVHDEWSANVKKTMAIVQRENLTNVRGIIGDAEHPKYMPLDILGRDRGSFFQAVDDLNQLIREMSKEYPDLSLGVTALWPLYLDSIDSDSDLSIIHRSSVDPPGGWNFVNVMTYSSFVPSSWRAYYVYLVERMMAQLYPDLPPSHLIGLVAQGRLGEPILGFDDLVRDARLSRAMQVREIVVFKLSDQVLDSMGHDFVRRFATAVNEAQPNLAVAIPFSRPASMLIYGILFADALLDALAWRGLPLLGWMILSGLIIHYLGRRASHTRPA
jgi:hypothetical protein